MDLNVVLMILRSVAGLVLVVFLGAVFAVLWRDYHFTARSIAEEKRQRGRLVVIRAEPETVTLVADVPTAEYSAGSDGVPQVPEIGISFPLLPVTSMGRAPTNTIVLQDTFCSQEHALVTRRDGQWWLEDLQSSNGTLLNDAPVDEPVVVSSGDVIGIGRVQLRVELE